MYVSGLRLYLQEGLSCFGEIRFFTFRFNRKNCNMESIRIKIMNKITPSKIQQIIGDVILPSSLQILSQSLIWNSKTLKNMVVIIHYLLLDHPYGQVSKINEAKINEHNLLGVIQLDNLNVYSDRGCFLQRFKFYSVRMLVIR